MIVLTIIWKPTYPHSTPATNSAQAKWKTLTPATYRDCKAYLAKTRAVDVSHYLLSIGDCTNGRYSEKRMMLEVIAAACGVELK
jgi:homoaconitase/3-isopropylmalate dehydratase large subunit